MRSSTFLLAPFPWALGLLACAGPGAPGAPAPPPAPGLEAPEARRSPAGTAAAATYLLQEAAVAFTVLADSIPGDPAMETLVAPFREGLGHRTGEVIGEARQALTKGWPEGALGNFAADAVLAAARSRFPGPVHMALVNNGGLRVPVPAGPITVGRMFELMPFENMLSVLELTGAQVEALAQEIARRGGEPVAGWGFRIVVEGGERRAQEIRVGGAPPEPGRIYRLATSDYLANGGDEMPTLQAARRRADLPLLIRDALIEYVRAGGVIEPRLEGRITGEGRR